MGVFPRGHAGKEAGLPAGKPGGLHGYTHRMPDKFTTEFESAILEGRAEEVADEKEKIHALRLLCQRHTPANMGEFDAAIARSLQATAVWKIHIDVLTGKRKRYGPDGRQMKRDAAV